MGRIKQNKPWTSAEKQLMEWVLKATEEFDIVERFSQLFPDERLDKTLDKIFEALDDEGSAPESVTRGWCVKNAQYLYRLAVDNGDIAEALKAVKLVYDMTK